MNLPENEEKEARGHVVEGGNSGLSVGLGVLLVIGIAAAWIVTLVAFHYATDRLLGR